MIPSLTELHINNLSLSRGGRRIFDSLTCQVKAGEILHLRGKNGSGKTSLLRSIAGLLPSDSGEIEWRGTDTAVEEFDRRKILLWVGVNPGLKPHDRVIEHCYFVARVAAEGVGKAILLQRVESALEIMGLSEFAQQPIQKLSTGQRQKLALTSLLLRPARLWLLDEPNLGLDAAGEAILISLLGDFCRDGGMVIMASHQSLPNSLPTHTIDL